LWLEAQMTIETTTIDANGLRFAIDTAGQGDTVAVLLHGFPECRASWHRTCAAMATARGRRARPPTASTI
jgi:pimeloyl-ACP methyl ester carboxylesterase